MRLVAKELSVHIGRLAVAVTVISFFPASGLHAQMDDQEREVTGQVQQIFDELQQLKHVNAQLYQRIQYLEGQLQQIHSESRPALASPPQQVAEQSQPPSAVPPPPDDAVQQEERRREPEMSRAVADVVQEEHVLFNQRFSVEFSTEYSHFDRSQLVLNGFLALDAIFLGEISIDEVEADIWTSRLIGRWGPTERMQLSLSVPWVYRHTTFRSGGQQLSSILVSEESVNDSGLGDISMGLSYQLWRETLTRPDIVWSLNVTSPTGRHPYGIKFLSDEDFLDPDANTNMQIPTALPTGSGLWSATTGLSFLRTTDPAILFANISYTHYLEESFRDISSDPQLPPTPGKVQLGDRFRLSAGLAFALNERSNMSFSFAQEFFEAAKVDSGGQGRRKIVGSKATTGSFDIGVTYALTDRLSVIGSLGIGLTQNTSDYTFSLRFPYRF